MTSSWRESTRCSGLSGRTVFASASPTELCPNCHGAKGSNKGGCLIDRIQRNWPARLVKHHTLCVQQNEAGHVVYLVAQQLHHSLVSRHRSEQTFLYQRSGDFMVRAPLGPRSPLHQCTGVQSKATPCAPSLWRPAAFSGDCTPCSALSRT